MTRKPSPVKRKGIPTHLCELHASDHALPRSHEDIDGGRKEEIEVGAREALL